MWLYHNWLMILLVRQAYVDSNSTSHPNLEGAAEWTASRFEPGGIAEMW